MSSLKNILLAVDFKKHSNITIRSVTHFAKENNCNISLIHVVHDSSVGHHQDMRQSTKKLEELILKIEELGVKVLHHRVTTGKVEEHVLAYAKKIEADMIAVGAGNYSHNRTYRLGTHAENVLRNSDIPVLIIKKYEPNRTQKILCPIDLTDASKISLSKAIEMAENTKASLIISHALEPSLYGYPGTGFDYSSIEHNLIDEEDKAFDTFLKGVDFKDIEWTKEFLKGPPAHEIAELCVAKGVSLVVMNSASRKGASRFILGSVAETVTKNVEAPCLILKPTTEEDES